MLSKEALEARRRWQREYYQKNKEAAKKYKETHWERLAQKYAQQMTDQAKEGMRNEDS